MKVLRIGCKVDVAEASGFNLVMVRLANAVSQKGRAMVIVEPSTRSRLLFSSHLWHGLGVYEYMAIIRILNFATIRTYRSQVKKFGYVNLPELNIKSELQAASEPFSGWIHLVCHPAQSECILDTSSVQLGPSSASLYLQMRQDAWYFPHLCQFLGSKTALWIGAQGPHALPTRTRLSAATDPARFLQEGQCILSRTRNFSREIMERPQEYLGSHKTTETQKLKSGCSWPAPTLAKYSAHEYTHIISMFSGIAFSRTSHRYVCRANATSTIVPGQSWTPFSVYESIYVTSCNYSRLNSDTRLRPVLDCRRSKWGRR